ncbi:MAG: Gfo/Idh/MocA family oxidoreductase [Planctomycetota bacterium]
MKRRITRRAFLGRAALGAGVVVLANSRSARTYAANEKLNLAAVGCGGYGRELLLAFCERANIVALCDVDDSRAAEMYRKFPEVPKFQDFRRMLDDKAKEIDGVFVATPDHNHAVISAAAIRAGKHVYTERPLTRLVQESRVLRDLARQKKVATSMGNQGTAAGPYRRALELVQNGALGRILTTYTWNDQGGMGWRTKPEGEEEIPPHLYWGLWLGPARARLYHHKWLLWQLWRDFGTAQLGNWASCTANLAFRSLKADSLWYADPSPQPSPPGGRGQGEGASKPIIKVQAKVDAINKLGFSEWEHVLWELPARGELPSIVIGWLNGGGRSPLRKQIEDVLGRQLDWGDAGEKQGKDGAGTLIVGTEGKLYANGHNTAFTLLPEEKFKDVQREKPEKLEPSHGHEQDWLEACKGGKPAWASYDYAGPFTEFNLLGNVATQFEGILEFDPLACKIVNNRDADKALRYEYREGWSL